MFRDVPAALVERVLAEAPLARMPAGSVLFDARQPCRGFPLVLEGAVRVAKSTPGGREILLYRVERERITLLEPAALAGLAASRA